MNLSSKSTRILFPFLFGLLAFGGGVSRAEPGRGPRSAHPKLYWFIPDGFRADRGQFNIFEWARKGELPNLKKLMDRGCYGYSRPVFPGHTPVNFATLLTGTLPKVHGVADGPMRTQGHPLDKVAISGFSSFAKRVRPIWVQLEKAGSRVSLLSVPGSTPPELSRGNTIRGRWGAWGIDFPSIIFQDDLDPKLALAEGKNKRLFTMGSALTRFENATSPEGWKIKPPGATSGAFEVSLENWAFPLFGLVYRSEKSNSVFDRVLISHDKKSSLAVLSVGQWSDWLPVKLRFGLGGSGRSNTSLSSVDVPTYMKIKIIRLGKPGEFRIRIIYDALNDFVTAPSSLAEKMRAGVGHMVDYVDNFPPQLIYFPEDKKTFLEEAGFSWDWHREAVPFLMKALGSDVVIQTVYTPNQMLTSRWWMPFIDHESRRYHEKTDKERKHLWSEVKGMYKQADRILGKIMENVGPDTYIVLSSDHGAVPLYREVRLNNLFAKKGWLKYHFNPKTREFEVDWNKTQVVYLQMDNIYINPKGLGGNYERASSPEYLKLRSEVAKLLEGLRDPETHTKVTTHVWNYENAGRAGLPKDRVGDLIIANAPQYHWTEDISRDGKLFASSLKGGYKQAIWPDAVEGMLTPFVIVGPKVKHGCVLKEPIHHVDQFATLAHLLGIKPPYKLDGRVLTEVIEQK